LQGWDTLLFVLQFELLRRAPLEELFFLSVIRMNLEVYQLLVSAFFLVSTDWQETCAMRQKASQIGNSG
jgi:hypothetical protein